MSCTLLNCSKGSTRRSQRSWIHPAYSRERDLKAGVGIAPKERDTRQPVFCVDQPADAGEFLRRQDAGGSREFGSGDLSAHGTGGNLNLRVVADAFAFPQLAVRHKVESVIVFGKPDRRVHGSAIFPERGKADVTLAVNFCWDGSHGAIVNSAAHFQARFGRRPGEFGEEKAQMTNQVGARSLTIANG